MEIIEPPRGRGTPKSRGTCPSCAYLASVLPRAIPCEQHAVASRTDRGDSQGARVDPTWLLHVWAAYGRGVGRAADHGLDPV
jgi:hypothetical protein